MQSAEKEKKRPNSFRTIHEFSCGAIIYTESGSGIRVLLMEQNNEHYKRTGSEALKRIIDIGASGRIEKGEGKIHTAFREVYEETGLRSLKLDDGFRTDIKYWFSYPDAEIGSTVNVVKIRRYWCARISPEEARSIKISDEHKRFWFEPIESAIKMQELEESKRRLLEEFYSYKLRVKPRR